MPLATYFHSVGSLSTLAPCRRRRAWRCRSRSGRPWRCRSTSPVRPSAGPAARRRATRRRARGGRRGRPGSWLDGSCGVSCGVVDSGVRDGARPVWRLVGSRRGPYDACARRATPRAGACGRSARSARVFRWLFSNARVLLRLPGEPLLLEHVALMASSLQISSDSSSITSRIMNTARVGGRASRHRFTTSMNCCADAARGCHAAGGFPNAPVSSKGRRNRRSGIRRRGCISGRLALRPSRAMCSKPVTSWIHRTRARALARPDEAVAPSPASFRYHCRLVTGSFVAKNAFHHRHLQHPQGLHPPQRRMVIHELRDKLHGLGADVVFLQEVQGVHDQPRKPLRRLPGHAALRIPGRHHLAAVRLRPQRRLRQRPPRQCACCRSFPSSTTRTTTSRSAAPRAAACCTAC